MKVTMRVYTKCVRRIIQIFWRSWRKSRFCCKTCERKIYREEQCKQISDIQKIIADKTSDNGAERTFRCQFNLKSLKYSNTATYYLVIADEQGLQLPQREPFQIDIAFAVDEFDFFS